MKNKLTLRLDENVIEDAKAFAESQGTSLSKLVEGYFRSLTTSNESPPISPFILSLTGILPAHAAEEEHREHLEKKHR